MPKKRELLVYIEACIMRLHEMIPDAGKLEYTDNNQASKRFKRNIVNFRENELKALHQQSLNLRGDILDRPKRAYNKGNYQVPPPPPMKRIS